MHAPPFTTLHSSLGFAYNTDDSWMKGRLIWNEVNAVLIPRRARSLGDRCGRLGKGAGYGVYVKLNSVKFPCPHSTGPSIGLQVETFQMVSG